MKISTDVLEVLDQSRIAGNLLTLPGQVDRKLYVAVNKVLEAAGGKWNRKAKAHVFAGDAEGVIEQVMLTGEINSAKQEFGAFFTPHIPAQLVMARANVQPGDKVLEPSAGLGNLAMPARNAGGIVTCVELLPKNFNGLCKLGFNAYHIDFLNLKQGFGTYDVVVMNPPFARQADIHHVLHAFKFLKPGGRLVAIMSASVSFRDNKLTTDFRSFVLDHNGEIELLPEGSFKDSGTAVNTCIVTMEAS